MRFVIPVLYLFLFTATSFAQSTVQQTIAGTKYSLAPPDGFVPAASFSGFQHDSLGASIMLSEMPAPVRDMIKGFTAEALRSKGMILLKKEQIKFNCSEAAVFTVSQVARGTDYLKQILVFGDQKKSVLVNGIYPERHKGIEKDIRAAILSTTYHKDRATAPEEAVKFGIDVTGTEFRLTQNMSGSLIYTTDGKLPSAGPALIVARSISKVSAPDKKNYTIGRLKKLPGFESAKIKEINPVKIDGLDGYEIVADGKGNNDRDEQGYLVMLFAPTGDYFMLTGVSADNYEANAKLFKGIARTFRRK
jgi:hypothetical protein